MIPHFLLTNSKTGRRLTPFERSVLLRVVREFISDFASARESNVCSTLFEAFHYTQLSSGYSPVTSAEFENKGFDFQSAKAKLLKQSPTHSYDFTWMQCATLCALISISPSPTQPYRLPPSPTAHWQQQLADSFDEEMAIFRHNPDPAVYKAFICSNFAFSNKPVETKILGLTGLDAWIASVVGLLLEKLSRRNQTQKNYLDTFRELLCFVSTLLVEVFRQLAEDWQSEELEVDTESNHLDHRKNFVLHMSRNASRILFLTSLSRPSLAIDAHWSTRVVFRNLEDIYDRYIPEIADDFKSSYPLGSNGSWSFLSLAVIDQINE